jgi:Periplasmic binding protein-like domain
MLDHFVSAGYTRPAVISTSPTLCYVPDIIAAYRRWTAERALEPIVIEYPSRQPRVPRPRHRCPRTAGLASAADSQLLQLLTPTVTSVELDAGGIGGTAVKVLLELLDEGGPAPGATVIPSQIIPRDSTPRSVA